MSKEKDVTINLGAAILIAAAAVCAIGLFSLLIIKTGDPQQAVATQIVKDRTIKLADMQTGMAKERASYRLISKEKGTVQLPLERAMEVTLADLQNQAPRPSGVPVDPAVPAAPTPTPTPAPDAGANGAAQAESPAAEPTAAAEAVVTPAPEEASN